MYVLSRGRDGLETNNYLNNYMIISVKSATKVFPVVRDLTETERLMDGCASPGKGELDDSGMSLRKQSQLMAEPGLEARSPNTLIFSLYSTVPFLKLYLNILS